MLTEIYSEAFKYGNGKERGPIPLHKGMNIVLGIDRDCNSVGKSSFLLAIDFAFGGTTYPTKEIKDQLNDHRICWKMEFGTEEYWFCRWTSSKDKVERCDKDYHEHILEQPMTIDEYIGFLYDKLKMATDEREYQILTSVFMRIHPKPSNIARGYPLASFSGEAQHTGIIALEKLMNKYEAIKKENEAKEEARNKSATLKNAEDQQIVVKLTPGQYNANENQIKKLTEEIISLGCKEAAEHEKKVSSQDETYAEINRNVQVLRNRRGILYSKRKILSTREPDSLDDISKDVQALNEFFHGSINVDYIEKIQGFQIKLQKILSEEYREELEEVDKEIGEINERIKKYNEELVSLQGPETIPLSLVDTITDKKAEILRLRAANKLFEQRDEIRTGAAEASKTLKEVEKDSLSEMMNDVNDVLSGFITTIYESNPAEASVPRLVIYSSDKYSYYSRNDGGAATAERDYILFDLAMMKLTSIPAVAHDNNLTSLVDPDTMERLFQVYQDVSPEKQVFLAFDKLWEFRNPIVKKAVQEATVLTLEKKDMNYLYGFHFDTKPTAKASDESEDKEESQAEQLKLF